MSELATGSFESYLDAGHEDDLAAIAVSSMVELDVSLVGEINTTEFNSI